MSWHILIDIEHYLQSFKIYVSKFGVEMQILLLVAWYYWGGGGGGGGAPALIALWITVAHKP